MYKNYYIYQIFRRLRQYFFLLLKIPYFFLFSLPWLRINSIFKGYFNISFGYQSILISAKDVFIKVALSRKSTIGNEYLNYSSIKNTLPYLTSILPSYQMLDGWVINALLCERMTKVESSEALPLAISIQEKLGKSAVFGRKLTLQDCPQIKVGLDRLAEDYDEKIVAQLRVIAEKFLLNAWYTSGVVHGDFHSRNIMKDGFGNAKIIDLDCVRFRAIREFDPLYFALEQVWSFSGQDWVESLANCFSGVQGDVVSCLESFDVKWSSELGVVFFLDRLGQDTMNYGIMYSSNKLNRLVNAMLEIK